METLTDRLREARQAAVKAKITLRHAENDRDDFLTWFNANVDYTGLGKNAKARDLAFAELLAKDGRAHKYETAVRDAEDAFDEADTELSCVLDEMKAGRDRTWAILAEWVSTRTASGQMGSRERAGQEVLEEQVETTLAGDLADYHSLYCDQEECTPLPPGPIPF